MLECEQHADAPAHRIAEIIGAFDLDLTSDSWVTTPHVAVLFGFAPNVIKPTVLLLNILVATIAAFQFWRAGHFSWQLFWPFAALSVPCAFLGGYLLIPAHTFKAIVGVVLSLPTTGPLFLHALQNQDTYLAGTFLLMLALMLLLGNLLADVLLAWADPRIRYD